MTKRSIFTVLVALGLAAGVMGVWGRPAALAETRPAAVAKGGLLINFTHGKEDLHAVSMGLGLADSALKEGHEVVVFLNVHAPVFAAKDLSEEVKFADFPPVKTMLAEVVGHGGTVLVCGHCADCCKLDRTKLVAGAKIISHKELLEQFKPGMVGVSY